VIVLTNEFRKFCIVGSINTGLNYLLFIILIEMSFGYIIAGISGFCFGATVSFYLNFSYTFNKSNISVEYITKFSITQILCLLLHFLVLLISVEKFILNAYLAQIVGLFITTITNFLIQKKWVFRT